MESQIDFLRDFFISSGWKFSLLYFLKCYLLTFLVRYLKKILREAIKRSYFGIDCHVDARFIAVRQHDLEISE